ncbi:MULTISPECIES: hypothetical protein [unclassified Anaerotruncus]|jgi:hypothetical protein|uniref:hypothetical protein n=1 Tax=unclassified Anaerotruncus TaxID=2641626 RepID=UPI000340E812|nr:MULTISPECIES: hypothetical protein [unclassified Anaerotruncus]EOS62895.1 hypothetical protein C814_01043 [Anaerotruncus sp. G3(2012)]NBK20240.1 hypothetical protein [Anaerotruncus sp. 1XD42-93]RKJ73370.1 hypothetical protein D7Y41_35020 [Anaerotruncus sp. 1XD22-93]
MTEFTKESFRALTFRTDHSIKAISKDWASEIREGISWVIVWKSGRNWNAQGLWLNPETETLELEDLKLAQAILEEDPMAIMINGYYCGGFDEHMTIKEIATAIRWHYENGYNRLDNSTAYTQVQRKAQNTLALTTKK